MNIQLQINEIDLRRLVKDHLTAVLNVNLLDEDITIEVKSKQNWKAEWESAYFRAVVNKQVV